MAAATWQQANGAKKCENKRPKTVRNRQHEKRENKRKMKKTVENKQQNQGKNRRKSAKTIGDISQTVRKGAKTVKNGGH